MQERIEALELEVEQANTALQRLQMEQTEAKASAQRTQEESEGVCFCVCARVHMYGPLDAEGASA